MGGFPAPSFSLGLADAGAGAVSLTAVGLGDTTPTFTRATTATTIGSTGLVLKGIASGVARSYYDPTSLAYMGYLAEGQRTNLLLRSEEFDNASWTKVDTTITADSVVSPDGTQNADLLTTGTAGTDVVLQAVTATADVTQTASRWLKFGNLQWVRFTLRNAANTDRCEVWFDLQNGVLGSAANAGLGTGAAGTIKAYPNGWYRCTVSGNLNGGTTAISAQTATASANSSTTRVNNATRYEWGAQFEDNVSFASSYIPTTSATVTRNADVLTYPFAGNASASAGACYAELGTEWATAPSGGMVAVGCTASTSNNQFLRIGGTGSNTHMAIGDGTNFATKSGLTSMATASRERVSSWGAGGLVVTGDGAVVATGSFDGAMGSTALSVGCATNGATPWFGTIKNVRIWQQQLTDSQLQAITAG